MIITDRAKKNILTFILLIIITLLGILLFNIYKKEFEKNKKIDKKETNTVQKSLDPVKNSVDDVNLAKKRSNESSTLGYVDAIEKQAMLNMIDTSIPEIKQGIYDINGLELLEVSYRGNKPTKGIISINDKGVVTESWLEFGEFKVYYNLINNKAESVDEFNNIPNVTCTVENNDGIITNNCN